MISLIRGDARHLPLADASVDLIVTSPPYFALRSYTDGGEHYTGQIGSEATPAEFIAALVECTREWMRVLKPTGSIWVNLGDKYSGGGQGGPPSTRSTLAGNGHKGGGPKLAKLRHGVAKPAGQPKSLLGLPWRYALACIDELGLILRAEVIWSKPNGLPESVTDRVRRSHEQWFHFVKQPRYFSAVDEIREPHVGGWGGRGDYNTKTKSTPGMSPHSSLDRTMGNPLGKLPGSVWEIASQPLTVPKELGIDHFAAFPMEWPRRIILGWSPSGICTACGEGRRLVAQATGRYVPANGQTPIGGDGERYAAWTGGDKRQPIRTATGWALPKAERVITGYACACPEPTASTRPAVVLDPFGGTGTTALVASVLGRHGISVDMSADYCRLAAWRTTDPKQIERAKRPNKPRPTTPEPEQPTHITAAEWLAHFGLESS